MQRTIAKRPLRVMRKTAVTVGDNTHRAMDLSLDEVTFIRDYLLQQKWHWPKSGKRRSPAGEAQHYLWQERNQATSWDDFCQVWGDGHMITADREHLIMPYELFLVDGVLGQLWASFITPQRKLVNVVCISKDMQADYGNAFNGYALLPTPERIAKLEAIDKAAEKARQDNDRDMWPEKEAK